MKGKDFTLNTYSDLILSLKSAGYSFSTLSNYVLNPQLEKVVIIRHDIDKRPENALAMANLEKSLDVKASYYFRIVKESNDPQVISEIVKLGHELGYHYEDLTLSKGDYKKAINLFEKNLKYFKTFYPVDTICMHGSPLTKWDNRDIWKKYDYRNFNINCEPYFDIDFSEFGYLTDTGRKWNSSGENIRDKVNSIYSYKFASTFDIINSIDKLPKKVMFNIHSQRWTNSKILWYREYISQNIKNFIKSNFLRK